MPSRQLSLVIGLSFFVISNVWSQTPLSVRATLGGGLLSPASSDIRGDMFSAYDYPLSNISFALSGKLRVSTSALPVRVVGSVSHNSLFDSAILPVATSSGTVNEKFTYAVSITAITLGVEYSFLSTPVLEPYASLAASLNFISGNAKYENNVIPESKMNSTSRTGLDLGIGSSLQAPFLPFSLDLEVKYRLGNIFGKAYDTSGPPLPGFGGLPQTSTYSLNDSRNPNDSQDEARSINYFVILIGVNITIL